MVSTEFEFGHGVDVGDMKFDTGAIGGLGQPYIQIFVFACFEKDDGRASLHVCDFVDEIAVGLGVELGIFFGVGEELQEI